MQQKTFFLLAVLTGSLLTACQSPLERVEVTQPLMGTTFRIIVYGQNVQTATEACQAAFARLEELENILSDYRAESELSRLSRTSGSGQAVSVSPELWHVLSASRHWSMQTDGAFDITVGPMVRLWRQARHSRRMPDPTQLAQARQASGYEKMILDETTRSCRLTAPGMRLDVGAIGKGHAADEALELLKRRGFPRALIDAGGDIRVGAGPPDRPGWTVQVLPGGRDDPQETPRLLYLSHAAIASSGDAFRFVEIDGRHYSHIVDPRTGLGLTSRLSVSVTAPDGLSADALSTSVSVLGVEKGLELVEKTPGAAAMVRQINPDGTVQVHFSKRAKNWKWAAPLPEVPVK